MQVKTARCQVHALGAMAAASAGSSNYLAGASFETS